MLVFLFKLFSKQLVFLDSNKNYYLFIFIKNNIAYYWFIDPINQQDIYLNYYFWKKGELIKFDWLKVFFDVWNVFKNSKYFIAYSNWKFYLKINKWNITEIKNVNFETNRNSFFSLFL